MKFSVETRDDIKLTIFQVLKDGSVYKDAPDPDNPDLNSPATIVDKDFGPDIECQEGMYFVIKISPRTD